MIILKSHRDIEKMWVPNQLVAKMHQFIRPMMVPGTTTMEIENFVHTFAKEHGATCAQVGYRGYPYAICASTNDVIAHGFPTFTPLIEGDIVTIDTVLDVDGWKGDSAWTYKIGTVDESAKQLIEVTKQCLDKGIAQAQIGNHTGDIGVAIQAHAERNGYGVVRDLLAHGIGRNIHEKPLIQHVGSPGEGTELREGMVITIEPMINEGTFLFFVEDDGWTARTLDGKRSAQFEHTLAITASGPLVLTEQHDHQTGNGLSKRK